MAVKIGSARIDENGSARGGRAGDQTGREVGTQNWYLHSKGWRVFRPNNPIAADKIAQDMQWACDNAHIGYDQTQRLTLYNIVKSLGFNCSKVTINCETDCSALVRVCCAYAGIMLPDFNTVGEASALLKSGAFTELIGSKYTSSSDYLRRGDILVTKQKGHTVIVLTSGSKAEPLQLQDNKLGDRTLKKGMSGPDVVELQQDLIKLGYSFPEYGVDGDFGSETEKNVRKFQSVSGLEANGIFDKASYEMLMSVLPGYVIITGNTVNVRKGPGTIYNILGVVHKGDKLFYGNERTDNDNGWLKVAYANTHGWVSEKYGKLVN